MRQVQENKEMGLAIIITLILYLAPPGFVVGLDPLPGHHFYVPNPFQNNGPTNKRNSFHYIKSVETIISNEGERSQVELDQLFSLDLGLSFSLHKSRDSNKQSFTILSDGLANKTYLVKGSADVQSQNCEHLVGARAQTGGSFPWRHEYLLATDGVVGERPRMVSIDGVAAIWLNAISRNITADQVESQSPVEGSNVWSMEEGEVSVELFFDKLGRADGQVDQGSLDESHALNMVKVVRKPGGRESGQAAATTTMVLIFEIDLEADEGHSSEIAGFRRQLEACHKSATTFQRHFPDLLASLVARSSRRAYEAEFIVEKFSMFEDWPSGLYDERWGRIVHDAELKSEWFSLEKQAQVATYAPVKGDSREDTYLRVFVDGARQTRGANYHYVEQFGNLTECRAGEAEPAPRLREHLFARRMHFRLADGSSTSGLLTGLGALLMNAADANEKRFRLLPEKLQVRTNVANLSEFESIETLEWQVIDKRSMWAYHFHFERAFNGTGCELDRLRLIVIRDIQPTSSLDYIVQDTNEMDKSAPDLVLRIDVLKFKLDLNEEEIEAKFKVPEICHNDGGAKDTNWMPEDERYNSIDRDNLFASPNQDNQEFKVDEFLESNELPNFYEFLLGQFSYEILSEFSSQNDTESISTNKSSSFLREMFNYTTNVAILQLYESIEQLKERQANVQYNIDHSSRLVYEIKPQRKSCEIVGLIEDSRLQFVSFNSDHDANFYGLAEAWKFAQRSPGTRFLGSPDSSIVIGDDGFEYKRLIWSAPLPSDNSLEYRLSFLFDEKTYLADQKNQTSHELVELAKFDALSVVVAETNEVKFNAKVLSFQVGYCPFALDYREYCGKFLVNTPGSDEQKSPKSSPKTNEIFPKIRQLTSQHNVHMQSEVVIESRGKSPKIAYLLDEHVLARDLRVRSKKLTQNIDILVDGLELFDLSTPYNCLNELPQLEFLQPSNATKDDLIGFWLDEKTLVDRISTVFYGPLLLWWLAEKSQSTKLVYTSEIAHNQAPIGDDHFDTMEKELRSEIWQLEGAGWSFDLKFVKTFARNLDGLVKERHILQAIDARDTDFNGTVARIHVDVVEFRYDDGSEYIKELFRLPDGYGCFRDSRWSLGMDDLDLNSTRDDRFFQFDSSLRLYSDDEANKVIDFPAFSGSFLKIWRIEENLRLLTLLKRVRDSNGTYETTKTVYDATNAILYQIDSRTGHCELRPPVDSGFMLEFHDRDSRDPVIVLINSDMFEMLFTDTVAQGFKLVNKYASGRLNVRSYELKLENFRLARGHDGPATIIRTFETKFLDYGQARHIIVKGKTYLTLHQKVRTRVMLFNEDRTRLRASFSALVRLKSGASLVEKLKFSSADKCTSTNLPSLGKQSRTFIIDYPTKSHAQSMSILDSQPTFKDYLYLALLKQFHLLPSQLGGKILMSVSENEPRVSVQFEVTEALSTHLYFVEKIESRMNARLEAQSMLRFFGSLDDCSSWCDQLDCVALSYCHDRTCRVLLNSDVEQEQSIDSSLEDARCSYFYAPAKRPANLAKIEREMRRMINELPGQDAGVFALQLTNSSLVAPANFRSYADEFQQLTSNATANPLERQQTVAFRLAHADRRLEAALVDEYNVQSVGAEFLPLALSLGKYTDCLDECRGFEECALVSYCKDGSRCLLVSGKGDIKRLMDAAVVSKSATDCNIYARDFTLEFDKFPAVTAPISYEVKLDGYSALECASACRAAPRQNCLSFDLCAADDQRQQTCYLQRDHITLGSFDRSLANSTAVCDHYSRAAASDYRRHPNKRLAGQVGGVVRGLSIDQCAVDCQLDAECRGFEFCHDPASESSQSCRYARLLPGEPISSNLSQIMADSSHCMVLLLLEENSTNDLKSKQSSSGWLETKVWFYLVYLLASLVLGAIFQLVYIKLFGGPLGFG